MRSNWRPNFLSSYLSNGEKSAKKDNVNEFRGSKNGGRDVWVSLECPENGEIRRPKVAAAASFAGQIWARLEAVRREISRPRSPSGGAPT